MDSQEIKQFIRENRHLFWYTPEDKKEEIDEEFLVETILNYGDMEAVKKMFSIMGINKTAKIFYNTINKSKRRKGNYHKLTLNYFIHLFNRYAL